MRRKDNRCLRALNIPKLLRSFPRSWTSTAFPASSFIHALGYHNTLRGLHRLSLWLDTGDGHGRILEQIAAVYSAHAELLKKAVAATAKAKTAEAQAAFLERCRAEQESFRPYIHVDGETTVPNGTTLFGVSGWHERWTTIKISKTILALSLDEQLVKLPELMAAYPQRYNGACPIFGKPTGFKFVSCSVELR